MMKSQNYIGLKARLSQAWMHAPLAVLVFYIVKLILLRLFIKSFLNTAKVATLHECNSLQNFYKIASDSPQLAINLANELVTASVNSAVKQFKQSLMMTLTAIEALVLFAFDLTLGTCACLTISTVNIAANEALNATEATVNFANSAAGSIGKDINKGLDSLSTFINGAVGLISSVESYFNEGNGEIKNISLTVNKLNNLSIPSDINDRLESLRSDIPTYQGTKEFIKREVSVPFDFVKSRINSSNISFSANLPVNSSFDNNVFSSLPQCDVKRIDKMFTKVESMVTKITVILCLVCGFGILCGILLNAWRIKSAWKIIISAAPNCQSASTYEQEVQLKETPDSFLNRLAFIESGFLVRKISTIKGIKGHHIWWLRYIFMRPLIDFLAVGLLGLVLSLLELSLIEAAKKAAKVIHEFEKATVSDISQQFQKSFNVWRNQTNSQILAIQGNVNTQMLGWLNQGSFNINSTISSFSDMMNNELSSAFNGTILYRPMHDALMCIVGEKIQKIENGLTWINENSQVSLPQIDDRVANISNISNSVENKVGGIGNKIVESSLKFLHHTIKVQLITSGVFLAIWFTYALVAYLSLVDRDQMLKMVHVNRHRSEKAKSPESATFRGTHSIHSFDNNPFNSWEYGTIPNLSYDIPSSHVIPSELNTQLPPLSPIQRIQNRVTRFFNGPQRQVKVSASDGPIRGSIHLPDDPKTPLKAMIF